MNCPDLWEKSWSLAWHAQVIRTIIALVRLGHRRWSTFLTQPIVKHLTCNENVKEQNPKDWLLDLWGCKICPWSNIPKHISLYGYKTLTCPTSMRSIDHEENKVGGYSVGASLFLLLSVRNNATLLPLPKGPGGPAAIHSLTGIFYSLLH